MCVSCLVAGVKAKVCRYSLVVSDSFWDTLRISEYIALNSWINDELEKIWYEGDCGPVQVTYWYLHGGTEEDLEGPQDVWHPAQGLN
jgi:hypothetical protein